MAVGQMAGLQLRKMRGIAVCTLLQQRKTRSCNL